LIKAHERVLFKKAGLKVFSFFTEKGVFLRLAQLSSAQLSSAQPQRRNLRTPEKDGVFF
jgi:hypothetical protein